MRQLFDRYTQNLAAYVEAGSEQALVDIEELGAEAIRNDMALEELTGLHEAGMLTLAELRGAALEPETIRRMSACFAALMLSALMTYRAKVDFLEWQRAQERGRTERTRQRLESLGTMVGGVAHEINNLLQPVTGLSELLLLDIDEGRPERRSIEIISDCARNAAAVVSNILAYVRQTGTPRAPIPLGEAVDATVHFLRPVLMLTAELVLDIADHATEVLGSESELTQVLLNLLQNAGHAGAKRIVIHVGHNAGKGNAETASRLQLSIIDDGAGMPPDVAARATEAFYTTRPPGEGSGLGLAIVAGIVRDWGGDLSVASELGRGTAINIRFPACPSE